MAIDTETSGLNPANGDRVIEWGAVKIINNKFCESKSMLINAPCRINSRASTVHGIVPAMLDNQPSPEQAWHSFIEFVGDAPLIAHNAAFDRLFIAHELSRIGLSFNNKIICTLKMARQKLPHLRKHTLDEVASYLLKNEINKNKLHRALEDAYLVARIWIALKETDHE